MVTVSSYTQHRGEQDILPSLAPAQGRQSGSTAYGQSDHGRVCEWELGHEARNEMQSVKSQQFLSPRERSGQSRGKSPVRCEE